jgi:hypothetical protein
VGKTQKKKNSALKAGLSIRGLARETGADRASIKKWTAGITDKAEALRVIRERQKKKEGNEANVDPDTGLTWFQAKQKEEALKLRRLNETAENQKNETWMATATHHEIVSLIMNQLEQLPGKVASQFGLDARQSEVMRRLIDEVRASAAVEIENLK